MIVLSLFLIIVFNLTQGVLIKFVLIKKSCSYIFIFLSVTSGNMLLFDVIFFFPAQDTYQSPHPVEFKKFFEGDIKLNLKQRRLKDGILDADDKQKPLIGEAATSNDKILWPNGVIPYEFDCSVGT